MLAEQALEAVEAILDLGEPRRIGLGALGVAGELARGLAKIAPRALEHAGARLEIRVELGRRVEIGGEPRELVADGRIALIELRGGAAGHLEQAARVAQAVPLGVELGDLARLRRDGVDGLELKREERLALAAPSLELAGSADLADDALEPVDLGGELAPRVGEAREPVEVTEVRRWIGQGDALVLRGDVGELGGEGLELAGRAEPAVHVRARSAAQLHDAANHELTFAADARGLERAKEALGHRARGGGRPPRSTCRRPSLR
jgi:hypothetical protein